MEESNRKLLKTFILTIASDLKWKNKLIFKKLNFQICVCLLFFPEDVLPSIDFCWQNLNFQHFSRYASPQKLKCRNAYSILYREIPNIAHYTLDWRQRKKRLCGLSCYNKNEKSFFWFSFNFLADKKAYIKTNFRWKYQWNQ